MSTFTVDDAAGLAGPDWLRHERVAAIQRFLAGPRPTAADEIWRYSRIDALDLDAFAPAPAPSAVDRGDPGGHDPGGHDPGGHDPGGHDPGAEPVVAAVGARCALVCTVDGHLASIDVGPDAAACGLTIASGAGVEARTASGAGVIGGISDEAEPWDAFVTLNRALSPDPVLITVPPGAVLEEPIVVLHRVSSPALVLPRTFVAMGRGSQATVIECLVSTEVTALVIPVVELDVGDGAHLDHVVVQELATTAWEVAYHASRVARDATLRSFTAALGGDYARVRTDSRLVGSGGSTELLALYFGDGNQMHDFRTLQDHAGPKSTSELLFKGAVTGEAHAAYSGLIRVRPGAAGTKAFQTNRNLVLSDTGLASYSVPNLDIEDNDVACSHASATGPIDPDQLFYLESRGVPTPVAERLIVVGFFDDLLERLPVRGLRRHLLAAVGAKLAGAPAVRES